VDVWFDGLESTVLLYGSPWGLTSAELLDHSAAKERSVSFIQIG